MRLSGDTVRDVVAEARLAPSVHNIQPSRWRQAGDRLQLLGDRTRSIPVADPVGRDWRLSHGAQFEGLSLALARRGLQTVDLQVCAARAGGENPELIAEFTIAAAQDTSTIEPIHDRQTWRGGFRAMDGGTHATLTALAATRGDCLLITDRTAIGTVAALADRASMHFLRDRRYREELLKWMRLSRRHPDYARDGLNADAMRMSGIESIGARLVLGKLFHALDLVGLAEPLLRDAAKTSSAAAIALFHRPAGEDAFHTGRAFYRAWLTFERHGLKGCPMSVLADWDESRASLVHAYGVPNGRELVNVFRIGVAEGSSRGNRTRLPVDELILPDAS